MSRIQRPLSALSARYDDLLLSAAGQTRILKRPDGSIDTVNAITLPVTPTWFTTGPFEVYDCRQVFLNVHVVSLAGAITQLDVLIEVQNPDYPQLWLPSLEGVARNVGTVAGHTITLGAVGDYVVASRQEHRSISAVRFSFQADAAVAAGTEMWATWYTDGAPSRLTEVTN
jgi:hypothetical protein